MINTLLIIWVAIELTKCAYNLSFIASVLNDYHLLYNGYYEE